MMHGQKNIKSIFHVSQSPHLHQVACCNFIAKGIQSKKKVSRLKITPKL